MSIAPVRSSRKSDALPAVAAVGRAEDAPLLARHPVLAERRDVDNGRIGRMDADLGDAVRVAEPDVLPGGARVAAAVDAVAGQDVAADAGFAGADEDEVGVGFGHRDRADRGRGDLEVGDGAPVLAAVGGLPEAAAGRAEVGFLGAAGHAGGGDGAAAAIGAEVAPGVGGEEGGVEVGLLGGEGGGGGREEGGGEEDGGNWGACHRGLPVGAGRGGASQPTGGWEVGTSGGIGGTDCHRPQLRAICLDEAGATPAERSCQEPLGVWPGAKPPSTPSDGARPTRSRFPTRAAEADPSAK